MTITTYPPTPGSDVLAEQLDEQLAIARTKQEADLAAIEAQENREREEGREHARYRLIEQLKEKLGMIVPPQRVELVESESDETRYDGDAYAEVKIGGKTFSFRRPNRWTDLEHSEGRRELVVLRRCAKGCTHPVWIDIENAGELLIALEDPEMQHHQWGCRVERDLDGNALTDDQGQPLPKPAPDIDWSARHREATRALQLAVKLRRNLEFTRPIAKSATIMRIMDEQHISATAAEKLVEADPMYSAHCHQLTQAVVDEIEAKELLAIARFHAGYQIELEGEAT